MARVNVDQRAFGDPRFDLLGSLLGSNRHEALGRMILVWNECQEHHVYVIAKKDADILLGGRGRSEFLIESNLAEPVENPVEIRVKGTEGRIEWLEAKRDAGRKGGKARAEQMGKQEPKHKPKQEPSLMGTPPAPAPAPALSELPSVVTSSVAFLEEKAGGCGNKFSDKQRAELTSGLERLLGEFSQRDVDIGISETFKGNDPPRTPALILRDIEANALAVIRSRSGGVG